MKLSVILACCLLFSSQAQAWCFKYAATRYKVDPLVVLSIAIHESNLKPDAIGKNIRKGIVVSRDYCLMQVNTNNVQRLIKMGVIHSADDLLNDPCLCVQAGTWILAKHLRQCGNTWSCLGSYNAGFSPDPVQEQKRQNYAATIRGIYKQLRKMNINAS